MYNHNSLAIRLLRFLIISISLLTASATLDLGYRDDSDLTHFVSRPEIKAPKFNVTVLDPERVTPGYWFVAPYVSIVQEHLPKNYYQACQTGPAIYDGSGELIWSGACMFKNQNTCDLRAFRANGTDHLSALLYVGINDRKGRGVILDDSFQVTHSINVSKTMRNINMHEMNIIEEGKTALYITNRATWADLTDLEEFGITEEAGWVSETGFREVETDTGKVLFEWWPLDHVSLSESTVSISNLDGPPPSGWNFFHMNSVDKNADGDYMISSRFTDCIYKISGQDGSVLWRLGGDKSSFVLDGFNFSKQHDARFIGEKDGVTIISFLDNASNNINKTSDITSGLLVALETSTTPMVAKVIRRWNRPDNSLSDLRGNFQILPNGNVFAGWSDNSYISEHTYDGDLVMTASFTSERFVTYRAWKHNFTSHPSEPPTLKVNAYGIHPTSATTVGYVSWNGATEVAAWEIFRNSSTVPLTRVKKDGFETMFQLQGFESSLWVQALSATDEVLGQSSVSVTEKPRTWPQHTNELADIGEKLGAADEATLLGVNLQFATD